MGVSSSVQYCPKCDAELDLQTDGSVLTCDIAHHGERVHEALAKLNSLIAVARADVTARLRLIVGTGLIRDEVCATLNNYERRGEILGFEQDGRNRGAIVIFLRQA